MGLGRAGFASPAEVLEQLDGGHVGLLDDDILEKYRSLSSDATFAANLRRHGMSAAAIKKAIEEVVRTPPFVSAGPKNAACRLLVVGKGGHASLKG
jgi:hypothetical protein